MYFLMRSVTPVIVIDPPPPALHILVHLLCHRVGGADELLPGALHVGQTRGEQITVRHPPLGLGHGHDVCCCLVVSPRCSLMSECCDTGVRSESAPATQTGPHCGQQAVM